MPLFYGFVLNIIEIVYRLSFT